MTIREHDRPANSLMRLLRYLLEQLAEMARNGGHCGPFCLHVDDRIKDE